MSARSQSRGTYITGGCVDPVYIYIVLLARTHTARTRAIVRIDSDRWSCISSHPTDVTSDKASSNAHAIQ
jgi:hypothetical protein